MDSVSDRPFHRRIVGINSHTDIPDAVEGAKACGTLLPGKHLDSQHHVRDATPAELRHCIPLFLWPAFGPTQGITAGGLMVCIREQSSRESEVGK